MSDRGEPSDAEIARLMRLLRGLDEEELARFVKGMPTPVQRAMLEMWAWQAHGGQKEPPASAGTGPGDWRVWLLMAGRGFGKTKAGAEWVSARARANPGARIALVGATIDEAVKVMVEGPSGLLAAARTGEEPTWLRTTKEFTFAGGATAFLYSGEKPSRLRGPEHDFAWCDELAKWRYPEATWDMLAMGLRRGERPRTLVTTTPRAIALVRRIVGMERTARTHGRTSDNLHSAADFREAMAALYGGTRLGRQELDGELIEEVEGALWTREMLEESRTTPPLPTLSPEGERAFRRVVIGVDPPAGVEGDACGIVAAGLGEDGVGYVLGDHSVSGLSPEGWATKVAAAAASWGAQRVVAEANNGGRMVETVLRGACVTLPVKLVHASERKAARAEPVACLFESKRAKLAGRFPELEDELCGLSLSGRYEGPGRSPDRADAMVWALTELMLGPASPEPRLRRL